MVISLPFLVVFVVKTILNPALVFACTVALFEVPLDIFVPPDTLEVVPPFAFQFQAT